MRWEVVQDFLNVPGIQGMALIDGGSRPYFRGVEKVLNAQQREALAQGIWQVLETIPDTFDAFEFQFTGTQVYIYKLSNGLILLVLTLDTVIYLDFSRAIARLRQAFEADSPSTVETFRRLSNQQTTQVGQKPLQFITFLDGSLAEELANQASPDLPTQPLPSTPAALSSQSQPEEEQEQWLSALPGVAGTLPVAQPAVPTASLGDWLKLLNQLSQFSMTYLGRAVIVNYWQTSRPKDPWLSQIEVQRSGKILWPVTEDPTELGYGGNKGANNGAGNRTGNGTSSRTGNGTGTSLETGRGNTASSNSESLEAEVMAQAVTPQQQQQLRLWAIAFTQRCSHVLRDFPQLIEQKALTPEQAELLKA